LRYPDFFFQFGLSVVELRLKLSSVLGESAVVVFEVVELTLKIVVFRRQTIASIDEFTVRTCQLVELCLHLT